MTSEKTLPLLIEIGCEEIPARFLEKAQQDLGSGLLKGLRDARLLPESAEDTAKLVQTYSTPRRLVAFSRFIFDKQAERTEELVGPPLKVAYDSDGKPTRAAESFAAKNNVILEDLLRVMTAKGEYLVVRKVEIGRPAFDILPEILPDVIQGLTFLKSMYWIAKSGSRFVRPIRWILALLGEGGAAQAVPFSYAGVQSGRSTYGHRLKGGKAIPVNSLKQYFNKLNKHLVEIDPVERRRRVVTGAHELVESQGMVRVGDEALESWVVNSTEWPVPLFGSFDPRYLALPREVLVTVMRDHQKYFAVEDEAGNLKPHFITMLNAPGDPKRLIRQGHERVLAARFADAEFFWNADQKITLAERIPMLERVTYQAKLGTYADKVQRMKALAEKICEELEKSGSMNAQERQYALRAVELCKCDLMTKMVQEFTELQGIMGGLYAKSQGEPAEVADAIYDHYRPAGVEDSCPRSVAGAVVSLADKLDSVISGFAVGLEPTGSSDPFGLRRAGNGIIKIAAQALPGINVENLLPDADVIGTQSQPSGGGDLGKSVYRFLAERTEHYLRVCGGLRDDTVRAIVYSFEGWYSPSKALERGKALEPFIETQDFLALALAAKRTRNILSKSAALDDLEMRKAVKRELLTPGAELDLFAAYESVRNRIMDLGGDAKYGEAFRALAGMRPFVDRFFDNVLVMDESYELRANRLRLLNALNGLVFFRFADLSQIETKTLTPVGALTSETNKAR